MNQHTSTAQSVGELYDRADAVFRAFWGDNVHLGMWHPDTHSLAEAAQNLNAFVADFAKISAADVVCDIGCGYGAVAHDLFRRCGADVTGITISSAQHQVAQQTAHDSVRFVHGDWLASGFPADSFSVLIALESYAHMPSASGFFSACHRVLNEDGRLAILEWHVSPQTQGHRRQKTSSCWQETLLEKVRTSAQLPLLGTAEALRREAAQSGFSVHSHRDLSALVRPTFRQLIRNALSTLKSNPQLSVQLLKTQHRGTLLLAVTSTWLAFELGLIGYHAHLFAKTKHDGSPGLSAKEVD